MQETVVRGRFITQKITRYESKTERKPWRSEDAPDPKVDKRKSANPEPKNKRTGPGKERKYFNKLDPSRGGDLVPEKGKSRIDGLIAER